MKEKNMNDQQNEFNKENQPINNQNQDQLSLLITQEYYKWQIYGSNLGIYVIPQQQNLKKWEGIIFVRSGLYQEGKFKFNILFGENFPEQTPQIIFIGNIYHPLINWQNGQFHLRNWGHNGSNYVQQILLEIKNAFIDILSLQVQHSHNPEAAQKFLQDMEYFYNQVQISVQQSKEQLYDENINFTTLKFKQIPNNQDIINKLHLIAQQTQLSLEQKQCVFQNYIQDLVE